MKVLGLDGRTYSLALAGKVVHGEDARPRSAGHKRARALLKELYPWDAVFEEVTLPGAGSPLYLDFLIPSRRLAVECNGRQHREATAFFGGSSKSNAKQAARDGRKREWLELNNIHLVVLDDDSTDDWAGRLRNPHRAGLGSRGEEVDETG